MMGPSIQVVLRRADDLKPQLIQWLSTIQQKCPLYYIPRQSQFLTGQNPFLTGLNHMACLYDWLGLGCLYCSNKHQSRLIYDNHLDL